jgi:hypothetical protein
VYTVPWNLNAVFSYFCYNIVLHTHTASSHILAKLLLQDILVSGHKISLNYHCLGASTPTFLDSQLSVVSYFAPAVWFPIYSTSQNTPSFSLPMKEALCLTEHMHTVPHRCWWLCSLVLWFPGRVSITVRSFRKPSCPLLSIRGSYFCMKWQWSDTEILQLSRCLPRYRSELETCQACLAVPPDRRPGR